MSNIIFWIIFGLIAGWLAKVIMPGKDPSGFIITLVLGVAGALIGGFIGRQFGFLSTNVDSFSIGNLLTAIVGAIILLTIYRLVKKV